MPKIRRDDIDLIIELDERVPRQADTDVVANLLDAYYITISAEVFDSRRIAETSSVLRRSRLYRPLNAYTKNIGDRGSRIYRLSPSRESAS